MNSLRLLLLVALAFVFGLARDESWNLTSSSDSAGPNIASPKVMGDIPLTEATGVAVDGMFSATFSEGLDSTTTSTNSFILPSGSSPALATIRHVQSTITALLNPRNLLSGNTSYTEILREGADGPKSRDETGNQLKPDLSRVHTTITNTNDCGQAPNPIVCENSKPGNLPAEWYITDAGDRSIQGFATDISVNKGGTIYFKIDTAAAKYRLDIYRIGYYRGLGARKVATVSPSATLPQHQPACLTDPSTRLTDCGNWGVSASWAVPADAISGFYLAKLVREDTRGASHVIFIVRDDASRSDLVVQASDTTWQAYNNGYGTGLYGVPPCWEKCRAFKVSYNRPFLTAAVAPQTWFFSTEYPMVRWLEANGYDVAYMSGMDTHRLAPSIIQQHKVFLSVGHDEYWSGQQRANVEAARAAGVHLGFFTGNEIFWKTRWEPSIDGSSTPHRTLVCYKETFADAKIDPLPNVWTGTWRDPRFSPPADGGRPENALSGTIFTVNGLRHDAITVPHPYRTLRFWRNTEIATLPANRVARLADGTLGLEWDEDLDNGSRPPGLIRLSSTHLDLKSRDYLQDFGTTYGQGTATHSLTLYRHRSGALVFGAGTMQWSWGLDGFHTTKFIWDPPGTDRRSPSPDVRMQQATVNLLADMGVQPGRLQAGLVLATASTDFNPPNATIDSPAAGSIVPAATPITLAGTASDTGGGIVAGVEVSTDGGVTWHPASGTTSWTYTWIPADSGLVMIQARAVDDSVNIGRPASVAVTVVGSSLAKPNSFRSLPSTPVTAVDTSSATPAESGIKSLK